jgi:hypothetical protein
MPLVTKLLFLIVGLGLAAFVILAFRHGQPSISHREVRRIEPIGSRRYNKLWVVDPDEER